MQQYIYYLSTTTIYYICNIQFQMHFSIKNLLLKRHIILNTFILLNQYVKIDFHVTYI